MNQQKLRTREDAFHQVNWHTASFLKEMIVEFLNTLYDEFDKTGQKGAQDPKNSIISLYNALVEEL
jgi:hypothetical protein